MAAGMDALHSWLIAKGLYGSISMVEQEPFRPPSHVVLGAPCKGAVSGPTGVFDILPAGELPAVRINACMYVCTDLVGCLAGWTCFASCGCCLAKGVLPCLLSVRSNPAWWMHCWRLALTRSEDANCVTDVCHDLGLMSVCHQWSACT